MLLSKWIKQERENTSLTQKEIATKIGVSQATISHWEQGKTMPNALEIYQFANIIGLHSLDDIPFSEFYWKGEITLERMSLYELPNADSIRTFEGRIYSLKGFVGVEKTSGSIEAITDLYYCAKTVVKDNRVTAKRKNKDSELEKVKPKKIRINFN